MFIARRAYMEAKRPKVRSMRRTVPWPLVLSPPFEQFLALLRSQLSPIVPRLRHAGDLSPPRAQLRKYGVPASAGATPAETHHRRIASNRSPPRTEFQLSWLNIRSVVQLSNPVATPCTDTPPAKAGTPYIVTSSPSQLSQVDSPLRSASGHNSQFSIFNSPPSSTAATTNSHPSSHPSPSAGTPIYSVDLPPTPSSPLASTTSLLARPHVAVPSDPHSILDRGRDRSSLS